ncbi:MAG: T9SS type A sorting domain-containing protein [Candidatus Kapabacteria bacterium]|nr:MAG: Filamentous hemagglutinin family outer membrane protein [Chlorobi bacterium OLB7]MBX7216130.1 T9SS type A sorting domain-containing protein [Candidatus Kapabacteria bacterium]
MLGKSQNSITFRDSLIREARRILQGSPTAAPTAPLHPAIFRLEVGHENHPSAYAGYIAMDRLIRETFNKAPHATASDSVAAINVKDNPNAHWYEMSDQREHTIETYFNNPFDVDSMFGNFTTWKPMSNLFTVPHEAVPAIGEHNGGRFTIPETNVSDTGIENYESSIQRMMLGRAFAWQLPGDDQFPFSGNALSHLSQGALICRDRRIRMVQYVGTIRSMDFRKNKPLTPEDTLMDTIMSHVPEAAELRAMANLGLAWNAKGITWWNFGDCKLYNLDSGARFQQCCIGNRKCDDLFGFQDNFDDTIPINTGGYLLVPGLYVGRHNIMTEIQWLNKNWFDTIGGRLMYLTWRNAYSADASAPWPGSEEPADSITRPLPSSEIITEVKSYKLNDTIPDSTHRTFVEVGFFDKLTGQTSSQPDPKKDTHYVVVVNRRMFERPADISPTSARGQLMDSLAENRRIRLKFNLLRKDFAQYEFIHVREYAPDLTPLAGTSTQRTPTSVTIPADGYAEIALRPGGAALLEIVYKQPDESLIAGKLQTNNQHKMVYVNGRYYCVYTKDTTRWVNCPNMTPQPISSSFVFLRRSLPVDTTGTILWEPIEDSVDYDDPCNFLTDNLHPALTVRRTGLNGAFTVVTVTWTAHVRDTNSNVVRAVYARDIGIGSLGTRSFGNIERVAYYHPTDPNKVACNDVRNVWGTPVVCRTSNGYFFVYSSATAGIVARVRKYTPGLLWPITGAYSGYDSISLHNGEQGGYGYSLYPSVPAFAHEGSGDSSCGIVWQQVHSRRVDYKDAYSGDTIALNYEIRYARLKQVPGVGGAPALAQSYRNFRFANNANGPVAIDGYTIGFNDYRNPCIDQTQDIYGRLQEMVTFQSLEQKNLPLFTINTSQQYSTAWDLFYVLRMRSIYTDPQEKSWLWGAFNLVQYNSTSSRPSDWVYKHGLNATVGSLNDLTAAVSTSPVAFFSIAYTTPNRSGMRQTTARYTEPLDSARKKDALYTYGGTYPQASCAPQHQATREAVLYQSGTGGTVLRTTRQFFARTRPSGYLAHGRSLAFSVDDSSQSAFHASLFDLWYATDSVSVPLHLAALPSYEHMELDSLPQVPVLFRTGAFQAHDSVAIGFSLRGEFSGVIDTLNLSRVRLRLELMDAVADTVVAVVDSGSVTMAAPQHGRSGDSVLDLLSGSYYLRLRLDTMNIPAVVWNPNGAPRYPVVDLHGWMEDGGFGKVRREGAASSAEARISAQPNPFTATTEVRFSIPVSGTAAVRVFDPLGRPVAEVVPEQWMEVGRYAVEFDGSGLQPGTYLIELMLDQRRVVQKLVLAR